MIKKILIALLACKALVFAGEINIAAAADLSYALKDIATMYEKSHPGDKVKISFGASGALTTQITQGAPFDLFFAANTDFPKKLQAAGLTTGAIKPYASGRLVILTKKGSGINVKKGIAILTDPSVKKISIANPQTAPYGKLSMEAFDHYKITKEIEPKIVIANNVGMAANNGIMGATDVAVASYSLVLSPKVINAVDFYLIPASAHPRLVQSYVMTKKGASNAEAAKFLAYFEGKEADTVMKKYGFVVE